MISGCPQVRYAVSAETTEPAADQPHPGDAARSEGQAAAADAGPREGGGAVQVLQARRSQHQDQGHAPVSTVPTKTPRWITVCFSDNFGQFGKYELMQCGGSETF